MEPERRVSAETVNENFLCAVEDFLGCLCAYWGQEVDGRKVCAAVIERYLWHLANGTAEQVWEKQS